MKESIYKTIGEAVSMSQNTVRKYVMELKEERGIKHSTIVRYKELAIRVSPILGHMKLREIRPQHLNELYTALASAGQNKRTGGGLSPKTILEHHRLLHITGARRGEVLGLKWDRVDFQNNKLHICNNILYTPDKGIYEDTPKTATSNRYISVPGETIRLLRTYRAWQSGERLRLGQYWREQDFVFAQEIGNPMHPDSVTDWLRKFSRRHNLPHINPHAFRHTMASMLYFNGVDSVSISKRLGHAQVSTTANIYAHVMEAADQKNADILDDIFVSVKCVPVLR